MNQEKLSSGLIGGATLAGIITEGESGLQISPIISMSSLSNICVVPSTFLTTLGGAISTCEEVLTEVSIAA